MKTYDVAAIGAGHDGLVCAALLGGSGANPGGCVGGFPGKRAATAIAADLLVSA